jgi:hypothetical protein
MIPNRWDLTDSINGQGEEIMKFKQLTLFVLLTLLLALAACKAEEQLDEAAAPTAEVEEPAVVATEIPPTPEPTPVPPTAEPTPEPTPVLATPEPTTEPVFESEIGMNSFTSSDESLSFDYPEGWSVEDTGPGRVILANSDDAMARSDSGALQSGDVRISITLLPANIVADYGFHLGNTAEDALQFIHDSGLFVAAQEDTQVGEIQSLELENTASAAQLSVATSDQGGALITSMQSDQVVAYISVVAPMGEYTNFEESVRYIVDSISVSVTADEMIALIMSSVQK